MEAIGGEGWYISYSFLTLKLDGVRGQRQAPDALYTREKDSGTHWIGGWVGPRAGLDTEVRGQILSPLPGIETLWPVLHHKKI
jgi:hypothetical protein